jgi:hypothetical protein
MQWNDVATTAPAVTVEHALESRTAREGWTST